MSERTYYSVIEVHDWPERAAPGPRISVGSGLLKHHAESIRDELEARNTGRCRYEVVPEGGEPNG